MKRRLLALAAFAGLIGLDLYRRIRQDRVLVVIPEVDERPETPYRLSPGAEPTVVSTSRGEFKLTPAKGYFGGTGIFLLFPEGVSLSDELSAAFLEATDGKFHLDKSPSASQGGIDTATALVTAGLNYESYLRDETVGYFKCSSAPRVDEVVAALKRIIV